MEKVSLNEISCILISIYDKYFMHINKQWQQRRKENKDSWGIVQSKREKKQACLSSKMSPPSLMKLQPTGSLHPHWTYNHCTVEPE